MLIIRPRARRFVARFPLLYNISNQITFWIVAFGLLMSVVYFANLAMTTSLALPMKIGFWPNIIMAIVIGILYGSLLGIMDYFLGKEFFRNKPLGKIILFKAVISLLITFTCF